MKTKKALNEQQTRAKFLTFAKRLGCEAELRQTFDKFDALLRNCTNPTERQQIAILANVEVHRLLGFQDGLSVDGQEIIPADPNFKPQQ